MQNPFKRFWQKLQTQELNNAVAQEINNPNQELCDNLVDFYRQHQEMFQSYFDRDCDQRDKKEFIKEVYRELDYTGDTMREKPTTSSATLYRGIRADSETEIKQYAEGFSDGEIVFGKKASLHGTGIYMSINEETAKKYATYDSSYGAMIKCEMSGEAKVINDGDLMQIKNDTLSIMRRNHQDPGVQQYAGFLELDNGAFAAIAGYDAINIPNKGYTLVLNRNKLFVEGIDYYIGHEKQVNHQLLVSKSPTQSTQEDLSSHVTGTSNEEIDLDELCQDNNTRDTGGKTQQDKEININELFSNDAEIDMQNMYVVSQDMAQALDMSMCDVGMELTLG